MTGVTVSIKNLWDCYPDTMRCLHHQNFNYKIALITKLLDPKIVVGGIYALDVHGPMYGEAKKTDLILSSNSPVVADTLGSSIMGFSPNKIESIRIAEKEGLGTTSLEEVRINKDWRHYKRQFHVKKTFMDTITVFPFKSDFIARAVFDSSLTPLIHKVVDMLKSSEEKVEWDPK